MRKLNTEEFISRAKSKHGDKYDYSKVNYVCARTKVIIICSEHGEFLQKPNEHLAPHGCLKCCTSNTEDFITKAKLKHKDKYDYSKVNYIRGRDKVIIICPTHGEFLQKPSDHLRGKGCLKCSGSEKSNTEDFITKAKLKHKDKYDYSKVNYIRTKAKVIIICSEHGEFLQKPTEHLRGVGCPVCKTSKAELHIIQNFKEHNINYEYQKTFDSCLSPFGNFLRFDFYLPDSNLLIEYDGEFHFEKIRKNHDFEKTLAYDNIKNTWATENNIKLIRINYKQNLQEELTKLIGKLKKLKNAIY